MGAVYPSDRPRPYDHPSELLVWEALRDTLPAGWRAYHSLSVRHDQGREGEGDFVIVDPDRGFVVLEVKGGTLECNGGHWLQSGRPMKQAPRKQAMRFAGLLRKALRQRCDLDIRAGVGCCFPDAPFSTGPQDGELHGIVIGQRELPQFGAHLRRLFEHLIMPGNAPRDPTAWVDAMHALWGETWVPRVGLVDRIQDTRSKRIRLNSEQVAILDQLDQNPRALVTGGAGTGKTIVARSLCERRAWAGEQVLYLCFTEPLARRVDGALAELRLSDLDVKADTVRRHARDLARDRDLPLPDPDDPKYWDTALTVATEHVQQHADTQPQLVVVDEAQDLDDGDWDLVRALAGDGDLWLFTDPSQGFWRARSVPDDLAATMMKWRLTRQERSPKAIDAFARSYLGKATVPEALAAMQGHELRLTVTTNGIAATLEAELDRLTKAGVPPGDIAVVSMVGTKNSEILGLGGVGQHKWVDANHEDATEQLVADTFLRFKGLERPIIVVVEPGDDKAKRQYETRMHIALTRAMTAVVVIASEEAVAGDPRLAALRADTETAEAETADA